jgi:hypothetical protein
MHALPHSGVAQGLEVSLRNILENLLFQRQPRHHSLELCVLFFQFLQSFCLIQLQAAVFFPPAVERPYRDFSFLSGLRGELSVRNSHFDLTQYRHDLCCFVPLDWHI